MTTTKRFCLRAAMTLLLLFMTTATSWAVEYEVESLTGNHGSFTLTGWVFEAYSHGGITFDLWLIDRATNEEVDRWNVKTSIYRRYCGRYVANGTFGYSTTREVSPGTYTIRSRIYYEEPVRRVVVVQPYQYFATFHTDHGTAPDDLPIPDNLAKSIPPMTCEGYTFVCWNTAPDGSGDNIVSVTNQSIDVYARWLPGSGTAEDPWRIASIEDWNLFRILCNSKVSAVSPDENTHVRLDADLTVTETLNSNEVFRGEFDGNGHTITINSANATSIGLFYTLQDCYIHDLKVQGTVANSNAKTAYMGGLAGRIVTSKGYLGDNGNGRSIVENCTVGVDLVPNTTSANCSVGGFIGRQENNNTKGLTFTNCEFNGSMPATGNCTAGFVGASASNLQFDDCIFAPGQMVQMPTYTFSDSYASASGIYYTEPGTTVQGEPVSTYLPSVGVYRVLQTAFGNRYYLSQSSVAINGLAASYAYTGSPVTVTFTVSKDNATLATNAYTYVIRNAAGEAVASAQDMGIYSLEVTIPGEGTYAHAFYVTAPLTQTNGVYQINNLADWTRLADDVASGNTYSGATVRLNADITTETMVGTADHKFSGTFDGGGHTLTYNYTSYKTVYDAAEDGRAPFRYINGATIRNLTVAGSTVSTGLEMGGLVAYAYGNNNITNCVVESFLTSRIGSNNAVTNGGFIAYAQDFNGSTTFSGCIFRGYLIGGASCSGNGGFVGWSDGPVNFTDCLFNPVYVTMAADDSKTFVRSVYDPSFSETYYTTAFGAAQGTLACMLPQDCVCEKKTMANGSVIYVVRGTSIEGLADAYPYNGGAAVTVSGYAVDFNGTTLPASKYTVTIRNSADEVVDAPTAVGKYTLTVTGNEAANYYGSLSQTFWVESPLTIDTDGSYLITDVKDWLALDYNVRCNPAFAGSKVKLAGDLSVTTMIGDGSHPFSGIFDGDGHTLTVNLSGGGTVAPFPFVSNATFINLRVAGTVSSTAPETWTGGLIGEVLGNVEITACRSSVNVTGVGQSMAGGIVATGGWAENRSITMRNCLFDGTLSGNLNFASGFVGDYYTTWSSSTLTLINCLMNGTVDTSQGSITEVSPFYCYAFTPTLEYYTITNCYHRFASRPMCQKFYDDQESYTTSTGTELRDVLGDGWTLYGNNVVPAMAQLDTRYITVAGGIEHGTLICPSTCVPGQRVPLIVTPDEGYESTVSYNDGTEQHTITPVNGVYSFIMPDADITVGATFTLNPNAISYMAYNPETKAYEPHRHISPIAITSATTTLGTTDEETWYMLNSNVTVSNRMTVNGTVNLILCDGKTLTAEKGITVNTGNTLNIYGQAGGTGTLNATGVKLGGDGTESAAIGSVGGYEFGSVTIHGGHVTADGASWSAGIGGGVNKGGGTVSIYGGTVNATGHDGTSEGIGHGSSGSDVTKTLADGLRVIYNNTIADYGNRLEYLGQKTVTVEPCTEHYYVDNVCTYCGVHHHHSITYNGNGSTGGTVPAVATFNVDGIITATGTVAAEGDLVRKGYSFLYWNTQADGSGTSYAPGSTITLGNDITLYAQWKLVQYYITYDLAGSSEPETPNPSSYTVTSGNITLNNPTREGYEFLGWMGTDLDVASTSVTIPAGSVGNRTYTATWLGLPPEVSLAENGFAPYCATVQWIGSSDSYTLQYAEGGPSDNPNLVWTTVDNNAHSPYTIDNLELETTYSVRVIGATEGQSEKVGNTVTFTTLERYPKPFGLDIVANTLTAHSATVSWRGFSDSYNISFRANDPANADFETGDLSQGAFTTTIDYPWTVVRNDHSGSWCAKSASGNDDETSSLELEVTLATDLTLTFSAKVSSEDGYDYAYFSIDGTDEIDGISGDGDWIDYSFPLTAGIHTLRWYYTKDSSVDGYDDCFYVDDIKIIDASIESHTYTSNATNYSFTGLQEETTYVIRVQGVQSVGGNGTTDWSEAYYFTTPVACPKPTDLTAGTPDARSVELSWTENGEATQWQICVNGDMSNLTMANTNPYTLSGLIPGTEYAVKIRAYKDEIDQSKWSSEVTFETEVICPAPTNVTASDIAANSATISWNSDAGNYTVKYREATIAGTTNIPIFSEGFENGLDNWTTYALGYTGTTDWDTFDASNLDGNKYNNTNHGGSHVAISMSYAGSNIGDVEVDNWLISPRITLGDGMTLWVTDDGKWHEHVEVWVCTASSFSESTLTSDFICVGELADANITWTQRTVDLSAYSGQQGYIAIRDHCEGKNYILIDDMVVYQTVNNYTYGTETMLTTTSNPFALTRLSAETIYEVQVQANSDTEGNSEWSEPIMFTTEPSPTITLTITSIGYSTYYNGGFDATLPAGMKARIVTPAVSVPGGSAAEGSSEGTLVYETIADGDTDTNTIPAGTAVMLYSEGGGSKTLTLSEAGIDDRDFSDRNLLHGSDTETTTEGGAPYYKLTYGSEDGHKDIFGWYWGAEGGAAFPCPAHKAWLALNTSNARAFIALPDEDTEGIKSLTPGPSRGGEGSIYTLDGRKLSGVKGDLQSPVPTRLRKGLYIRNGRKIIIK